MRQLWQGLQHQASKQMSCKLWTAALAKAHKTNAGMNVWQAWNAGLGGPPIPFKASHLAASLVTVAAATAVMK